MEKCKIADILFLKQAPQLSLQKVASLPNIMIMLSNMV